MAFLGQKMRKTLCVWERNTILKLLVVVAMITMISSAKVKQRKKNPATVCILMDYMVLIKANDAFYLFRL